MAGSTTKKEDHLERLRRIEGQVSGLPRREMVAEAMATVNPLVRS